MIAGAECPGRSPPRWCGAATPRPLCHFAWGRRKKKQSTKIQQNPAQTYFAVDVTHGADDQNASTAAAITSMTTAPNTIGLVSRAASSNAATRVSRPGSNTDWPMRRPAPPHSKIGRAHVELQSRQYLVCRL